MLVAFDCIECQIANGSCEKDTNLSLYSILIHVVNGGYVVNTVRASSQRGTKLVGGWVG